MNGKSAAENKVYWDSVRGISLDMQHFEECDPLAVIEQSAGKQETVIFLENYHHFLETPAISQAVLNAVPLLKSNGSTLVILSPILKIPPELNALVRVLDHELPEDQEYLRCLNDVLPDGVEIEDSQKQSIIQAGSGMTLNGFEDAVALSLVRDGQVNPEIVWKEKADMIVVSQTPLEALTREWEENKMDHYLHLIAGQEHGTKTEHLHYAANGKYDSDKILMVGDAPGDYKAAKANDALFVPIVPGSEEQSWARFAEEGITKFFNGEFDIREALQFANLIATLYVSTPEDRRGVQRFSQIPHYLSALDVVQNGKGYRELGMLLRDVHVQ